MTAMNLGVIHVGTYGRQEETPSSIAGGLQAAIGAPGKNMDLGDFWVLRSSRHLRDHMAESAWTLNTFEETIGTGGNVRRGTSLNVVSII